MCPSLSRCAVFALMLATSLPLAAQTVKIEDRGEAANLTEAEIISAAAIEGVIGKAPSGRSQVVFYRPSTSPGAPVAVRDVAGSQSLIDLHPGMYFVALILPGSHSYATADNGPLPIDLQAGRTYYVQATRNRKGDGLLRHSNAERFKRAAR